LARSSGASSLPSLNFFMMSLWFAAGRELDGVVIDHLSGEKKSKIFTRRL
jgi:hypothetical protein